MQTAEAHNLTTSELFGFQQTDLQPVYSQLKDSQHSDSQLAGLLFRITHFFFLFFFFWHFKTFGLQQW